MSSNENRANLADVLSLVEKRYVATVFDKLLKRSQPRVGLVIIDESSCGR